MAFGREQVDLDVFLFHNVPTILCHAMTRQLIGLIKRIRIIKGEA
jgi:hypothetical protein